MKKSFLTAKLVCFLMVSAMSCGGDTVYTWLMDVTGAQP